MPGEGRLVDNQTKWLTEQGTQKLTITNTNWEIEERTYHRSITKKIDWVRI